MAELIKGADVRARLVDDIKQMTAKAGVTPVLGIVRVGENPSDLAYEKGILKTCASTGVEARVFALPADISQADFEAGFRRINDDAGIHGILLFSPLPEHLSGRGAAHMINPEKDMDCISPANWAKLAMGESGGYAPCTAEAIMKICEYAGVDFKGKNAVIFGRSLVVGRPLGYMMTQARASVTWCNSLTRNPVKRCEDADILVSACGVPDLIRKEHVMHTAPGCIAIDAGINFADGRMCGDFAFDEVEPYVAKITPVPGGVGAVTNTILALHAARAAIRAKEG